MKIKSVSNFRLPNLCKEILQRDSVKEFEEIMAKELLHQ
jgi:hypothetical protein